MSIASSRTDTTALPAAPSKTAWTTRCGVVYLILFISLTLLLKVGTDRWAWTTVLAYGPRWPLIVPGALLLLLQCLWRRLAWIQSVLYVVCAAWLLDAHFSCGISAEGTTVKVITLNAHGGASGGTGTDPARLKKLVTDANPDAVFLQEWTDHEPPDLLGGPWNVQRLNAQMTLTRLPVRSTARCPPEKLMGKSGVLASQIELKDGKLVWIFNVHLETPRPGFERLIDRQPGGLALIRESIERRSEISQRAIGFIQSTARGDAVVIAGDFNMVPDGAIFRNTWGHFKDTFAAVGIGTGGTKLQAYWKARIDHVLVDDHSTPMHARVGLAVGSDHLPLLAEIRVAR